MPDTLDTKELEQLDIEIPETSDEPTLFDGEEPDEEQLSFKLEIFAGPLDLLLALTAKNKVNIWNVLQNKHNFQFL